MPSGIEDQFDEVYRVRQSKGEDRQKYLDRLIAKVNETSDDNWELLTEEAQNWFNAAVKPWSSRKKIPDFPDIPDVESTDDVHDTREASAGGQEEDDTMAASKKRGSAAKKKAAPKRGASAAGKKTTNGQHGGEKEVRFSGSSVLKRAMLRNMRASEQELRAALKKEGVKLSPVRLSILRSDMRQTMRILQEDGKLKDNYTF